jgi:hypothetical protein
MATTRRGLRLPKEIYFGDSVWSIKVVRKITEGGPGKGVTLGLTDSEKQEVTFKSRQSFEDKLETLVHECAHIIEHEYDIEIPHWLVYKIAKGFTRLLIDNYF